MINPLNQHQDIICEIAPAKINLYLHVGGLRDDGLHELASMFVFTQEGDNVCVLPCEDKGEISLDIIGPFAEKLSQFPVNDNLVLKAAHALADYALANNGDCDQHRISKDAISEGARLRLEKNLPIAAGIGGGSADAAAALRALIRYWGIKISDNDLTDLAFSLGADVPACLWKNPILVSGAGEDIEPAATIVPLWVSLINPDIATPTGPIFKAFDRSNPAPGAPLNIPNEKIKTVQQFKDIMAKTHNDLAGPAVSFVPVIQEIIDFIQSQDGVLLARMSGSGATCFGIFPNPEAAQLCADQARNLGWWAMAAKIDN